jgi:hypothetical protein
MSDDLVNDAREQCGGVDDNPILWNVFLRVMQSRNEFPFRQWLLKSRGDVSLGPVPTVKECY